MHSDEKLSKKGYKKELKRLRIELRRLQKWVKMQGMRVVLVFEGRDAAGKGGAIKRLIKPLNPRFCRVVALDKPTEREQTQWYFQRYVQHLPSAGEIVIFDRSWYNRAGVERVMGFCTDEEYERFLRDAPKFEQLLISSGILLIKYWFSVSAEEQKKRFKKRINSDTKRWKLSAIDLESRARWQEYSRAKDKMFAHTDTEASPWYVVPSDIKRKARLNCIHHFLSMVDYEEVEFVMPTEIALPPKQEELDYERPPIDSQRIVPQVY